jgi:hypothetical protein
MTYFAYDKTMVEDMVYVGKTDSTNFVSHSQSHRAMCKGSLILCHTAGPDFAQAQARSNAALDVL